MHASPWSVPFLGPIRPCCCPHCISSTFRTMGSSHWLRYLTSTRFLHCMQPRHSFALQTVPEAHQGSWGDMQCEMRTGKINTPVLVTCVDLFSLPPSLPLLLSDIIEGTLLTEKNTYSVTQEIPRWHYGWCSACSFIYNCSFQLKSAVWGVLLPTWPWGNILHAAWLHSTCSFKGDPIRIHGIPFCERSVLKGRTRYLNMPLYLLTHALLR